MEKISDTKFREVIPQPDLVVEKSLDDLVAEKENLELGIQNNQDAIVDFTAKLDAVNQKIKDVKNLGVQTEAEALQAISNDMLAETSL